MLLRKAVKRLPLASVKVQEPLMATEAGASHAHNSGEQPPPSGDWWTRHHITNWVVAIATVVYVLINAVMLCMMWWQLKVAQGSLEETRRALVLTERPWVSIETANFAIPTSNTLYIIAGLRNTGRTPIVDLHVQADAYIGGDGKIWGHGTTQPYWTPRQMTGPNQPLTLKFTFTFKDAIDTWMKSGASPNVSINIRYTDQFGNSYPQPFCFYFDRGVHDPSQCGMKE
jgi:hypothetical protein